MFKFKFVFLPLLVIALVIITVINLVIGGFSLGFGESRTIEEEKTASLTGVSELAVDSVSTDVNVILTEDTDVKAHFYGTCTGSSEHNLPKLEVSRTGSSVLVKIKWPVTRLWNFGSGRLNLDVYLPKSYVEKLSVSTVSGDMDVSKIRVKEISLKTISGDINGTSVTSMGGASLSTVSGDMDIGLVCGDLTFGTVSGGVNLQDLVTNSVSGKTISGSVELGGFFGETKLSSVSGSMNINCRKLVDDFSLSTTSGSCSISFPNDASFMLDFSSVSGSFSSGVDTIYEVKDDHKAKGVSGSGEHQIKIRSISGSVNLND